MRALENFKGPFDSPTQEAPGYLNSPMTKEDLSAFVIDMVLAFYTVQSSFPGSLTAFINMPLRFFNTMLKALRMAGHIRDRVSK